MKCVFVRLSVCLSDELSSLIRQSVAFHAATQVLSPTVNLFRIFFLLYSFHQIP